MKTYNKFREKLTDFERKVGNSIYDGLGDSLTMEVNPKGLSTLLLTGFFLTTGAGCAAYTTNLAINIKGDKTRTAKYDIERFHLDNKKEYIINREPKEFMLPDGKRIKTDAIIDIKETESKENGIINHVIFTPKGKAKYDAIVPVDFSNDGKKLYLVDSEKDRKDRIYLLDKFNLPRRNISEGFGVEKVTTESLEIDQTIYLPYMKNVYAFKGKFPVYTDSSLTKLVKSEPVLIMSTDPTKTNPIIDYETNQRGLEGALHVAVQLPLAPPEKTVAKPKRNVFKEKPKTISIINGFTTNKATPEEVKKKVILPRRSKQETTSSQLKHQIKPYIVQEGESPWEIAYKFDMCNEQFSDANPKLNCINPKTNWSCDTIYPGQEINVWKK